MKNGKGDRVSFGIMQWTGFLATPVAVIVAVVIAYQTARSDIDTNTRDVSRLIDSMDRLVVQFHESAVIQSEVKQDIERIDARTQRIEARVDGLG